MSHQYSMIVAVLAAVCVAGCNRGQAEPLRMSAAPSGAAAARGTADPATRAADSAQMAAIKRSIDSVTTDLNTMSSASAAAQERLLPAHERLVSEFLTRNDAKMRAMHVSIDPDWLTVIDSVRHDLAAMKGMPPAQLHAFFPQHMHRVMRIVACIDMRNM